MGKKTSFSSLFSFLNKYIAAIFSFCFGILFIGHFFKNPVVKDQNDLFFIKDKIQNYSFRHGHNFRNKTTNYYFWLESYDCTFQIKADFEPDFDRLFFEKNLSPGDAIKISIPKKYKNKLNSKCRVFVMSIEDDDLAYLSKHDTIKKENDSFNIYAGIGFILFGILIFLFKRLKK